MKLLLWKLYKVCSLSTACHFVSRASGGSAFITAPKRPPKLPLSPLSEVLGVSWQ